MNLNIGQAFQPAGLPDFPVRWTQKGDSKVARTRRLESLPYEPVPAHGPNAFQKEMGLSMNPIASSPSFSRSCSIRWLGFEDEQEDDWVHGPNARHPSRGGFPRTRALIKS